MKRQVYLKMTPLHEARNLFFSRVGRDRHTRLETIKVHDSLGRVIAEPVYALRSSPSYHSAAMDGIAVKAENTYKTTEIHPAVLRLGTDALWINTGQAIPAGFDSVIMVEKLHQLDEDHIEIRSSAYPWQNIRKVGEDIVATELLFPRKHRVRPCDIGAMTGAGVFDIQVFLKPSVVIIPTGSELVSERSVKESEPLEKGKIIEYNSKVLAGQVLECSAVPKIHDIVSDSEDDIRNAISIAVESDADMIIINAGSSAGSRDFTAHIIGEMGEVLVHGVSMMPGKPTVLGIINDKPVIGIPGYPVSAMLSFEQFARPLLYGFQNIPMPEPVKIPVYPTRDIPSRLGLEEFLRVNIGKVGDKYIATPLPRAAGSITSLTRAEGIIRIPSNSEGISQKEQVEAELLVGVEELNNTVVITGSHDIAIDILADIIRSRDPGIRISSGNVGSLGGLVAIKKGSCHMAGSHLLDPASGLYNLSYAERYLKGMHIKIFNLVLRDQGLIVQKGNPKNIKGIKDLERDDISYVNRQAGSGTRVLLDYKLKESGINTESINGYTNEVFTHISVAVDILSGAADCGLGILAAAKALDLGFIPVDQEQYDLIIPDKILAQPNIQILLETVSSKNFRDRVRSLGGYDPSNSGLLWKETGGKNGHP